jgi:hypothetical protein
MGRPARIPDRGDVARAVVARRLGLSLEQFDRLRPDLERRKFPGPDPTTGHYCMEAVDRWRLYRYPRLFPELTAAPVAQHADAVFYDRLARLDG